MSKMRGAYAPEFRRQMVELVHAGRTPEELAHEFEPTAQTIRNRIAQAARDAGRDDDGTGRTQPTAALEAPAPGRAGNPLKGGGLVRSGDERNPIEGFRFVSDHQVDYPVATMCRVLDVSPKWPLCVAEAAAIAPEQSGCDPDRGYLYCPRSLARYLRRAAHSCRACGQGHSRRPQARRATDVTLRV
jgi:transposase